MIVLMVFLKDDIQTSSDGFKIGNNQIKVFSEKILQKFHGKKLMQI